MISNVCGIDAREEIEIDEAVVHRRDQRVGRRMRLTGQKRIAARRVDDDEVEFLFLLRQEFGEMSAVVGRGLVERLRLRAVEGKRDGHREPGLSACVPIGAVLEMARETPLPRIEIDRRHALAEPRQRHGKMDGRRGLARPALLIADDDDVGAPAAHALVPLSRANNQSRSLESNAALPPAAVVFTV